MLDLFDAYTIKARIVPAFLATAPTLALVGATVTWDGFSLPQGIATVAIFALLYAFADVARRRGKAIEPALFENGKPATTMLRHRDNTINAQEKVRYLAFIARQLNETAPSAADEARDPAAADDFYERASNWLRQNTGDRKRFDILFSENVTYGFRRNLFALKSWALVANTVVIFVAACLLAWTLPPTWTHPMVQRLVVVVVFAVVHSAFIATLVRKGPVIEGREQYAERLIFSTGNLMAPTSVKARRP